MSEITERIEKYRKKISESKDKVDKLKETKIVSETRFDQAKEQEEIVIDKIKTLGYNPDNLKGHIQDTMSEIEALLEDIEKALPDESGNISKEAVDRIKQHIDDEDIEL